MENEIFTKKENKSYRAWRHVGLTRIAGVLLRRHGSPGRWVTWGIALNMHSTHHIHFQLINHRNDRKKQHHEKKTQLL